jgi:methylated-DNA-[protein]-cysteine S-methyltransferase
VQIVRYEVDGWGVGELWFDDGRLVNHELPWPGAGRLPPSATSLSSPGASAARASSRKRAEGETRLTPTAAALLERLDGYFHGKRVDFADVAVDLDWCTPFQRAVADTLRAVPWGETVTYGELAALAGHPNAHRAAGSFCAANRFPLVIPCHRVLAAGGVGSYGSYGSDYKRRLLALEGLPT